MSESSSPSSVGPSPSSDGSDYRMNLSHTRTRSVRKSRGGGNGRSQRQRRLVHRADFTDEVNSDEEDIERDEMMNCKNDECGGVGHFERRRKSERLTGGDASGSKSLCATRSSLRCGKTRAKRKAAVVHDNEESIPHSSSSGRPRKASSKFAANLAVMQKEDNKKCNRPRTLKRTRKLDSRTRGSSNPKKTGGGGAKNKRNKSKAIATQDERISESPERDSEEHSDSCIDSGSEVENWLGSWRDVGVVEENNVLEGTSAVTTTCKGERPIPELTEPQPLFVIKGKKKEDSSSILDVNNPHVATDLLVVWDFLHMMSVTESEAFSDPLPDAKRYKVLKKKLQKRNSDVMRDEDDKSGKKQQQQYANINWTNPLSMRGGGKPSLSQLAEAMSDPEGPWVDMLAVRLVDMLYCEVTRLCTLANIPSDRHGDRLPSFGALNVDGTRPNSVTWPEFLRKCIGALSLLWKMDNIGEGVPPMKPSRWLLGQHDRSLGAAILPNLVIPAIDDDNNPGPPQKSSLSIAAKTRDTLVKDALSKMLQYWAKLNGSVIEAEIEVVQKEQKLFIDNAPANHHTSVPVPALRQNEQRRSREVEKLLGISSAPISGPRAAYTATSKYGKENIVNFLRTIHSKNSCPKWACLILDIKDMPTKNGSPVRNNVTEAARLVVSSSVRATLEASLSDRVYRGNSCGRTKEMALGVLVDWIVETPSEHVQHFTGISVNEEGQPILPGTDKPMKDAEWKNPDRRHDLASEGVESNQVHTSAEDSSAAQGSEMGNGGAVTSLLAPVVDEEQASRMSHVMRRARALLRFLAFIPETRPFHLPVNRLQFRNYDRHVRRPMDMREVDRKLARGEFGRNLQRFVDEVGLIWRNAQKYNDPSSDVAIAARHFATVFEDLLREWVLQPWMDVCTAAERNGDGHCNGAAEESSRVGRRKPHALTAARALAAPVDAGGDKVLEQIDAVAEKAGVPLVERHVKLLLAREPWSDGCQYCRMDVGHENTLVCDGCDREYHIGCMNPPIRVVPEGDWYCTQCRTSIALGSHPPTIEECSSARDELKIAAGKIITVTLEAPGVVGLATSCRCIIRQLAQKPEYAYFLDPVDLEVYTDYLDYVTNPMDFRTIDRRLESGYYISPRPSPPWPKDVRGELMVNADDTAEFQHKVWVKDMRTVASNAQKYNSKGGDVYEASRHLREDIDKLYKAWILAPLDGRDGSEALLPSHVDDLMALNGGWDDGCMICGMTCYDIVDDGNDEEGSASSASGKVAIVHSPVVAAAAATADRGGKAVNIIYSTVDNSKDTTRQNVPFAADDLPQQVAKAELSLCQGEFAQEQQQQQQMITHEEPRGQQAVPPMPWKELDTQPTHGTFSTLQHVEAILQQQQHHSLPSPPSEAVSQQQDQTAFTYSLQTQLNLPNHHHLQQEHQQDVQRTQYYSTVPSSVIPGNNRVNEKMESPQDHPSVPIRGEAANGGGIATIHQQQQVPPPPLMAEQPPLPEGLENVKKPLPPTAIKSESIKAEMIDVVGCSEKKDEKEGSLKDDEESVHVQEYICCKECGKLAHVDCLNLLLATHKMTTSAKNEEADQKNGKTEASSNWICHPCKGDKEEFSALRKAATQLHELTPSLEPWRDTSTGVGVKRLGITYCGTYNSQGLAPEADGGYADEDYSNGRMAGGRSNLRRRGQQVHSRSLRSRGANQKIVVLPCTDCHEKGKTGLNCRVVQSHHRQVDYVVALAGLASRRWNAPQGFFEWLNGELPDAEVVEENYFRDEEKKKKLLEEKTAAHSASNKRGSSIIATGGTGEGEDPNAPLYLVVDDVILPKLLEDYGWRKREFVSGGTKRIELFSSDGFRTQSKRGMVRHIASRPDQYRDVMSLAMEETAKRAPSPTKKTKMMSVEKTAQVDSKGSGIDDPENKDEDVCPPNWDGVNLSLLGSVVVVPSTKQASQGLGVLEGVVTGFNYENGLYTVQYSGTALSNGHVPYWTDHIGEEHVKRAFGVTMSLLGGSESGCPCDVIPSCEEEGETINSNQLLQNTMTACSATTSGCKDGYAIDDWCLSVASQLRKDSLPTIPVPERLRMLRIIVELSCIVGPIKEHIEVLRARCANFWDSIAMLRYDWHQLEKKEKKQRQKQEEMKLKNKSSSKQQKTHKRGRAGSSSITSSTTKRAAARKQQGSKQSRPSKAAGSGTPPRPDGIVCIHNLRPRCAYGLCSKCYHAWRKQVKEEKNAAAETGGSSGTSSAAKVKRSSSSSCMKVTKDVKSTCIDEVDGDSKDTEDVQGGGVLTDTPRHSLARCQRTCTASVKYSNFAEEPDKVDVIITPAINFDCERAQLLSKTAQLRGWAINASTQVQYIGKDATEKKYFCFRADKTSLYTEQPNGLWGRIDIDGVKSLVEVLRVRVKSRGGRWQWSPPPRSSKSQRKGGGGVVQEEHLLRAIQDLVWMTDAIKQAEAEKEVKTRSEDETEETADKIEVDEEQEDGDGGEDDREEHGKGGTDETDDKNTQPSVQEDEGECPLSDLVEYCIMRMADGGGGGLVQCSAGCAAALAPCMLGVSVEHYG